MNMTDRTAWAPEHIRCLLLYKNGKLHIRCKECGKVRSTSGKGHLKKKIDEGKHVEYCRECDIRLVISAQKVSPEVEASTGVRLDHKYYNQLGNVWVGKWCDSCLDFSPVRVSSILEAHSDGRKYTSKCKSCNRPGRIKTLGGYISILAKSHPNANKSGYVLEHRLVMEQKIGRFLESHETVHHINGVRDDNRPENLQLRQGRHGAGVVRSCGDCGSHNILNNPL